MDDAKTEPASLLCYVYMIAHRCIIVTVGWRVDAGHAKGGPVVGAGVLLGVGKEGLGACIRG